MGLRRRIERLLQRSQRRRSSSQSRCCQLELEQQQQQQLQQQQHHQIQPQLGRRGPTAAKLTSSEQAASSIAHRNSRLVERRGNHYSGFATSSSSCTSSSSSTTSSSSIGAAVRNPTDNAWRPDNVNRLQFFRLESGASTDVSCCVAELSASSSSTGSNAPVYEEIAEPLYDRVAGSCIGNHVQADGCHEDDCLEDAYGERYWIYASLPRRRQRHCSGQRHLPPPPPVALVPLSSSTNRGQLPYPPHHHLHLQQQRLLPLGCTQIDWRGVKCTSF